MNKEKFIFQYSIEAHSELIVRRRIKFLCGDFVGIGSLENLNGCQTINKLTKCL